MHSISFNKRSPQAIIFSFLGGILQLDCGFELKMINLAVNSLQLGETPFQSGDIVLLLAELLIIGQYNHINCTHYLSFECSLCGRLLLFLPCPLAILESRIFYALAVLIMIVMDNLRGLNVRLIGMAISKLIDDCLHVCVAFLKDVEVFCVSMLINNYLLIAFDTALDPRTDRLQQLLLRGFVNLFFAYLRW